MLSEAALQITENREVPAVTKVNVGQFRAVNTKLFVDDFILWRIHLYSKSVFK